MIKSDWGHEPGLRYPGYCCCEFYDEHEGSLDSWWVGICQMGMHVLIYY